MSITAKNVGRNSEWMGRVGTAMKRLLVLNRDFQRRTGLVFMPLEAFLEALDICTDLKEAGGLIALVEGAFWLVTARHPSGQAEPSEISVHPLEGGPAVR